MPPVGYNFTDVYNNHLYFPIFNRTIPSAQHPADRGFLPGEGHLSLTTHGGIPRQSGSDNWCLRNGIHGHIVGSRIHMDRGRHLYTSSFSASWVYLLCYSLSLFFSIVIKGDPVPRANPGHGICKSYLCSTSHDGYCFHHNLSRRRSDFTSIQRFYSRSDSFVQSDS